MLESFDSEIFVTHPFLAKRLIGNENWDNSLGKVVMDLQQGVNRMDCNGNLLPDSYRPPKAVFLTATSAIPFGFSIKECWNELFPDSVPGFYIVDVSLKQFPRYDRNVPNSMTQNQAWRTQSIRAAESLRDLGDGLQIFDNVAVVDEHVLWGRGFKRIDYVLKLAGYSNINYCHGKWGVPFRNMLNNQNKPVVRGSERDGRFSLGVNSNAAARTLLKDMKLVGIEMAEEIRRRGICRLD